MRTRPALALTAVLALTGCYTPQRVSAADGVKCEAEGYEVGTDAYVRCALALNAARHGDGEAPAAAPVPIAATRQVCDQSQLTQTPDGRYVIYESVVYDKATRLTWQRCSVGQQWKNGQGCTGAPYLLTWDDAKTGANKGWRLPTEQELLTLTSPTCKFPSINTDVFPNMDPKGMWYWSITPDGATQVWGVDFRDGRTSAAAATDDIGAIRLVRSED